MFDSMDRACAVREGERLDHEALESFLQAQLPGFRGPLEIEQFPRGYSNLTYLLRWAGGEMVLRRPPAGNQVKSAHDMGREYRILEGLYRDFPLAPRPWLYCADAAVLGTPFYVMERRRGLVLRDVPLAGLHWSRADVQGLCETFIDTLARLHRLDPAAMGLGDLGKPEGYMQRQVRGWTGRYRDAQTDEFAHVEEVAGWLAEQVPAAAGGTLIHNDYKFDNVMLDPQAPTRMVALLDWEMATLGDPLADLGIALAYWVESNDPYRPQIIQCFMTVQPGSFSRRDLAERYAAGTGRDLSRISYYYCFALFRLAVIVQQIYYRYVRGFTKDQRFANLQDTVRILGHLAAQAAEAGEL